MSSITGLRSLNGTSITNTGFIALGNELNQGLSNQVIKSNGANKPVSWEDETPHTNQALTMGTNINLTSGNPTYDGSIAETINSINTDTTYTGSDTILINGADEISVKKLPNKLLIGSNLTTTSGDLFYDGSVTETLNATNTDTTYTGSNTILIDGSNEISVKKLPQVLTIGDGLTTISGDLFYDGSVAETIKSIPKDLYKDINTGKYYRMLKPTEFMNDNDVSGINKTTISDANQHGSQQCNGGTQYYVMFEIPTGFNFTGYKINLVNSTGTQIGNKASATFYTQPGFKGVNTTLTLLGSAGAFNYNNFNTLPTPTGNGWSNTWTITNTLNFGVIMCYKNPWSLSEFNRGGYVEFTLI